MHYSHHQLVRLTISLLALSMVTACGGGAAGDNTESNPNNTAVEAVEALVGVWDLPNDWNGVPNDEAYLLIKSPNAQGEAEAIIYDLDDAERNCFEIDGGPGTISQSLTNELFMDVSAYPAAVVALTLSGELEISVYSESSGTGVPPERVLIARQLDITENEIALCS